MSYSNEQLVAALVTSPTLKEAAQTVGCHRSTLTRKMNDPEFAEMVKIAKRDYLRTYLSGAVARQEMAVDTLLDVLQNNPDDSLKLRAADILLKSL